MSKRITTLPICGSQHPCIPVEMAETYRELYESIDGKFDKKKLSRFFPYQGSCYKQGRQLSRLTPFDGEDFPRTEEEMERYYEPAVRLLVVGRSVNGWEELNESTVEKFVEAAANQVIDEGFSWLDDDGKAISTYKRESDNKECRYNVNRSAFFRCIKKIITQMKPEATIGKRWFEHVAWTNLYPIAPLHSGNAEGKLQDAQIVVCKKLLLQQIDYYQPTHILFITDWDWWFERFADAFPKVRKIGDSAINNIVGVGSYDNAKVAIAIRPDRTRPNRPNEEEYVRDVVGCFRAY